MSIEFKLPELGENIEGGDVVNVLVNEGDTVAMNDGAFELETDKAVIEVPCPHAGKIVKIHAHKGDTVKVGQTLLEIETEDDSSKQESETKQHKEENKPQEKAAETSDRPAANDASKVEPTKPQSMPAQPSADEPIPAGPAARRLARELEVDLRSVQGSGQHGRITPEDVVAVAQGATTGAVTAQPMAEAAATPPGQGDQDTWGPIRRERMSKIRRTIAAQMSKSVTTIPHVTNFDDADITELETLRKGVPSDYLGEGVKLTTLPFVIKALALALRQHPTLNASLDEDGETVIYKEYVHMGVAVDTPRGLVVPKLRNADRMSIIQIARELKLLADRARLAQFAIEDLRGGTFTISNLGAVGGAYSTPIINHPEVAILLVGRARWMPVVRKDNIEKRMMMPLSLSYDHRLVDGATAGRFLNEVIDYLQTPGKLVLVS